jgi:hypothetical protein
MADKNKFFKFSESKSLWLALGLLVLSGSALALGLSVYSSFIYRGSLEGRELGSVTKVHNDALRQSSAMPGFFPISEGDPVYIGDTVMVGKDSAMQIVLFDEAMIELADRTMIRLDMDFLIPFLNLSSEYLIELIAGTASGKSGTRRGIRIEVSGEQFRIRPGDDSPLRITKFDRGSEVEALGEAQSVFERTIDRLSRVTERGRRQDEWLASLDPDAPARLEQERQDALARRREEEKLAATLLAEEIESAYEEVEIELEKPAPVLSVSAVQPSDRSPVISDLALRWKSSLENARFRIRIHPPQGEVQNLLVQARDQQVDYPLALEARGQYRWDILNEDSEVLSTQSFVFIRGEKKFDVAPPAFIGRFPAESLEGETHSNVYVFRWNEVSVLGGHRVGIFDSQEEGANPQIQSEVSGATWKAPIQASWLNQSLFFQVEAFSQDGYHYRSERIPFRHQVMSPYLRTPPNQEKVRRSDLLEGSIILSWTIHEDQVRQFFVRVSSDPLFKDILFEQETNRTNVLYYPRRRGKYYWQVRGKMAAGDSPYSETWMFEVQ